MIYLYPYRIHIPLLLRFFHSSFYILADGATIEDIRLFSKNIGPNVKMKAAGGVKSREDLEMFLDAGCDRIGTSSAVKMLEIE